MAVRMVSLGSLTQKPLLFLGILRPAGKCGLLLWRISHNCVSSVSNNSGGGVISNSSGGGDLF